MKFRTLLCIFFEESINSHRRTRPKPVTWRLCHMVAWWQAAAARRHLRPARRQFRNPIKNDIGGYTRPRPVTWRLCRSGLGGRLQLHGGIWGLPAASSKPDKLHRHRPQIEKISETFFHAASMGQWYSGCLDKQISQHLPTQLTWANILWKRVLFCLVEWSKWWCVWTQRFACRIDITEVASKKKCFSLPPTISNLGTLKSHLKAILVPNDSSKSGNFHASVLLGFA